VKRKRTREMHPDFEAAVQLLLQIAGPSEEHIEMSRVGPAKYYTIPRPVTFDDCVKHLRGIKTRGAALRYPGHMTRALAFDADTNRIFPGWWWMIGAAQSLVEAGYRVILEPSPAGRGGHLWIIFDGLVDARAARHHVYQIAPMLADVYEYWPGPAHVKTWNKVRLPGGRYVRPEMSAWCKLYDVSGSLLADQGLAAASVLLSSQTPAGIVPPLSPEHLQDLEQVSLAQEAAQRLRAEASTSSPNDQVQARGEKNRQNTPAAQRFRTPDARPQRKFSEVNRFLWFIYTPAQVAAWYNERHTVDDLVEFDHKMANAEAIGRFERTPSLGSTRDRQHWADFGSGARQDDGRPDGGDVLELKVRVSSESKPEILSELGHEMVAEARAELESAARASLDPPTWVQEILSESGWSHYWQLRKSRQHKR
jgi:hypothetical protein